MKIIYIQKNRAIPVTDRGGLQGCEIFRIPHYEDNPLTGVGEVLSLSPTALYSPEIYLLLSLELISVKG
jgi:hypothetical protein